MTTFSPSIAPASRLHPLTIPPRPRPKTCSSDERHLDRVAKGTHKEYAEEQRRKLEDVEMSEPEDEEPMMEEEEPEVEEGKEELEGEGGEGEEGEGGEGEEGEKPEDEGEGEEEGKGAEEGEGEEDPADEFSDERPKASPSARKSKSAARGFRNSWVDIKPGLTWDERESKERKAYGKKWKMNTSLKLPSPAEMRVAAARDTYEAPTNQSTSAARGFRNSWVDITPGLTWDERESKDRKAYGKKWKMNTSLKLPSPAEMRVAAAKDTYEAPSYEDWQ